jgi:GNAT superfamily N-acetyltransferase
MALFYPKDTDIPERLQADELLLRPLTVDDVELDYAALMVSKEMLRRWGGGDWPADNFTLQDNLEDLEAHQREHLEGQAFTYTVMHSDRPECLGCVYIDPLAKVLAADQAWNEDREEAGDYQASVRFWVKEPRLADGLDRRLLRSLISWCERDWAFKEIFFRANDRDGRQIALLEEAGFKPHYAVDPENVRGRYLLYGSLIMAGQRSGARP